MNNTYSLFANHRFAAYQYRNALVPDAFLLRLFVFLIIACASLYGTKAHSGPVCIPQGFEIFPSMPSAISLGKITYNGGTKLLYDSSVTAAATSSCSNSPNATLDFVTLPTRQFDDTVVLSARGDTYPWRAKFMYSTRSTFGSPFGYYSMMLYYYITIDCRPGEVVFGQIINNDTFRVTGLQSCSSYTVDYRVSIYQNDTYVPIANFTTVVESLGIRMRTNLLDDRTGTLATVSTSLRTLTRSNSLKLMSGVYCTYSLSTSTVDLGTWSSLDLLNYDTSRAYTINMQNCQNASGRQVSVFWRFDNPDPGDDSVMLSSVAGGASGVVARTACSGTVVRHNQPLVISANLQGNLSVACSAELLPARGVSTVGQIAPGRFRGIAYLVFQFQ